MTTEEIKGLITDQTKINFANKYGYEEDYIDVNGNLIRGLRPDAQFSALADQMNNPDYLQKTSDAMSEYDRTFARAGGSRSRGLQAKRAGYLTELDLKRKQAVNQYMESQKDLFNKWYNEQMFAYQKSSAPSEFQLAQYGLGGGAGAPQNYTVNKTAPKYEYKTPYNASSMFKYGGYTRPKELYGRPTLMPVTPI